MSPNYDYSPGMWKHGPTDPEKKKLERLLESIEATIILTLVIVLLLFGRDMSLWLIFIVLGLIFTGLFLYALIKLIDHRG